MGKTYVKVSGTWKQVNKTYVKVSGVWKACSKVYVKVSGVWKDVTGVGDTGVFGGGYKNGSITGSAEYITISSLGDAQYFGFIIQTTHLAATSNGTNDRGVFGGGTQGSNNWDDRIRYVTISTPSDAQDFGSLTYPRDYLAATSNGTNDRGVFGGGHNPSYVTPPIDVIDYITISTLGDAQDFGDMSVGRLAYGATSNGTNDRGVFGGGYDSSYNTLNVIDYITISTLGDAQDFGDLTVSRHYLAATSNGTNDRGVFGGGYDNDYLNVIDYITISTLGDAQDFGSLIYSRDNLAATSNGTNDRGVFGGGASSSGVMTRMDYITISTPSNINFFGNLSDDYQALAATSNA